MRSFGRTGTIFLFLAMAAIGLDWVARNVLNLDCVGPQIYGWGCLFSPYPTGLTDIANGGRSLVTWTVGAAVLWAVATLIGETLLRLAGRFVVKPPERPAHLDSAWRSRRYRR